MKIAKILLLSSAAILLATTSAQEQSSPGWSQGFVPTAAQWNAAFAAKQDFTGTALCSTAGCTFTGELVTVAPNSSFAGFNLPPGTPPTTPNNGDVWTTSAGLFAQINGSTVGPYGSGAPGGSTTDYQFNSGGNFGGATTLTHSGSTDTASGTFNATGTFKIGGTTQSFPASGNLVGTTDAQTFSNKIITSSSNVLGTVTMTLGSDATGDVYYRNSSGMLTRLGVGSNGQVLELSGGLPTWATVSGAGTVTTVTITPGTGLGSTGTCTSTSAISCTLNLSNPVTTTAPTTQVFLSGSGTYTTPAGVKWVEIEFQGAGGGGSGGGSAGGGTGGNGGDTCWRASGAACTTPLYDAGGGIGATWDIDNGGAGGTVSGSGSCYKAIPGGQGQPETANSTSAIAEMGGAGGSSTNGGGGGASSGGQNGFAGATNSGGGGGGAGQSNVVSTIAGAGGGAGANCHVIIGGPSATYTYAVGAAGTAGSAGTSGFAGGAGAAGGIWVREHYNY